jgi:hypothetical protein
MVPRASSELDVQSAQSSAAELAALEAYIAKGEAKVPMARTKVETRGGVVHLSFDHANQVIGLALVANAFGTGSSHFVSGLLGQLADVSRRGAEVKSTELDFMLTVVRGIAPRDETEALLAVQMSAIHNATLAAARRLNHVGNIAQHDSNANVLNKLARTFAVQLEALKKYRTAGDEAIKVQNVTVNNGGQAIVSNVQRGSDHDNPVRSAPSDQPSGALAPGATMFGDFEEITPALPGASRERQEGVPVPRRPRRRTKRIG